MSAAAIGRFITLEGIEGAGKSTVAHHVVEWLRARSRRAHLTREPGGTPLAERVRAIVLERGGESLSAATETLLMFAARGIHVENLIRPALALTSARSTSLPGGSAFPRQRRWCRRGRAG